MNLGILANNRCFLITFQADAAFRSIREVIVFLRPPVSNSVRIGLFNYENSIVVKIHFIVSVPE